MSTLQLTSLILFLPISYMVFKFWKKDEINMFDLLLSFSILHFSISPFLNSHFSNYDENVVYRVFEVLLIYEVGLLLISILWDNYFGRGRTIINVTFYLRSIKTVYISKIGYVILVISVFLVMVIYMPYATLTTRMKDAPQIIEQNYSLKILLSILSFVLQVVLMIISLRVVSQFKKGRKKLFDFVVLISGFLVCAFFPRRVFLECVLFLILCFYSICRNRVNLRFVTTILVVSFLIFQIYFPFYNIIRNNPVRINIDSPVQSLYGIVQYGIEHQGENKKSMESTKQRTLGLYDALYFLQKNQRDLCYGELLLEEVDLAIPKFINPNKGSGSEGKLQIITNRQNDIADSILLEACGDFGFWGAVIAPFLFVCIFVLYSLFQSVLEKY